MKKTLLAASLGLAFFLPPAEAGVFDFSFTLSDNRVLSGKIDGTLQADNNTVLVNSVLDFASFDGTPLPSMTYIEADNQIGLPMLSLDGSIMSLSACSDLEFCRVGFGFGVGRSNLGIYFSFADDFNETYEKGLFNPDNWSLTSSSESLPAPATLPLLAMGGLFMAYRRRKAV